MTVAAEYLGWLQIVEQYNVDDEALELEETSDDSLDEAPSKAKFLFQKYSLGERKEPEQLSMLTSKGKFRKSSRPQTRPGQGRRTQVRGRDPQQLSLGLDKPPEQQRMQFRPPRGTARDVDPTEPNLFTSTGRPSTQAFRARSQAARAASRPQRPRVGRGPVWAEEPTTLRQATGRAAAQMAADEMPSPRRGTPARDNLRKLRKMLHNIQKSGPTVGLPKKGPIRKHFDKKAKEELKRIKRDHKDYLRDRSAVAKKIEKDGSRRAGAKRKEANRAAKDRWKQIKREGQGIKKKIRAQGKADADEIVRITQRRARIERGKAHDNVRAEVKRAKNVLRAMRKEHGLRRSVLKVNPKSPYGKGRLGLVKGERMPPELGEWE